MNGRSKGRDGGLHQQFVSHWFGRTIAFDTLLGGRGSAGFINLAGIGVNGVA